MSKTVHWIQGMLQHPCEQAVEDRDALRRFVWAYMQLETCKHDISAQGITALQFNERVLASCGAEYEKAAIAGDALTPEIIGNEEDYA